ncbi:unnamed protein product [Schistocephalus solidus]|uniref:Uncharacterized protein n=1 Tax=Schistocephalus solidus TaxID=70667 RepID=A0A3P7CPK7_SCHSO|nr:unnamed protein product [Schistocephalus solidus]
MATGLNCGQQEEAEEEKEEDEEEQKEEEEEEKEETVGADCPFLYFENKVTNNESHQVLLY